MYVMPTCPYCDHVLPQAAGDARYRVVNIAAHVRHLSQFLALRDSHPAFAEAKRLGDIGVPCYVLEDGTVTLSSREAGLEPLPDGPSCRLDGSGC